MEDIEGWASGAPEIYDEVVRDILRYKSGKRVSIYNDPGLNPKPDFTGINRLYQQAADYHRQDEEVLKMNLLEMIREILGGEGRIHYRKGACQNRRLFFSAERPTYFNPFRPGIFAPAL